MQYIVISPKNKLMCFENKDQVLAYCMEKDNEDLDKYCEDQQLTYENMTPVEIGYAYASVGAQSGGCRVYDAKDVLRTMVDEGIEREMIEEASALFYNRRLDHEIDCPGYLEDFFSTLTPVPISTLCGRIYQSDNVDGPSTTRQQSGI